MRTFGAGKLHLDERNGCGVGLECRPAGQQSSHAIGVRDANGQRVQLLPVFPAEGFCCGHLQHDGMLRAFAGGHGDAVVLAEVFHRLNASIRGVEVDRRVGNRHHAFDWCVSYRLVAQVEHDRQARHGEVDAARDDRIVGGGPAGEPCDLDLGIGDAELPGVFLDQLAVESHQQWQIRDAELLDDAHGVLSRCGLS